MCVGYHASHITVVLSKAAHSGPSSNDVDPLETPYTGSTLDLIHGQVHPFHGIE
jgi:hypothetical protein